MQNPDVPMPENGEPTTPMSAPVNQDGATPQGGQDLSAQTYNPPTQPTYSAGTPPGFGGQSQYQIGQQPGYPTAKQPPYAGNAGNGDIPPTTPVVAGNGDGGNGRKRGPVMLVSAILLVVLLIAAVGVVMARGHNLGASSTTPSVSTILSNAKSAKLTSATFNFTGQIQLALPANATGPTPVPGFGATTFSLTGSGKFTSSPTRAQLTTTIPIITQSQVQIITDGSNVYVQGLGGLLGGTDNTKWVEFPISQSGATTMPTDPSKAYDLLKNPTLVGAETINGKATWHITGTIDPLNAIAGTPGVAATATAITKSLGSSFQYTLTEDIWLTQDTYLPAQIAVHATVAAALPAGLAGGIGMPGSTTGTTPATTAATHVKLDFTATLADLNGSDITIATPSPDQVTTMPGLPTMPGIPGAATPTPTS